LIGKIEKRGNEKVNLDTLRKLTKYT
jgi:hypothetical protein